MDRILRPDRLEIDPNSPEAAKVWRHWKCTFSNYVDKIGGDPGNLDKLSALFNFIGPNVFELVADCTDYESALTTLQSAYDKPKNVIFARHLLSTCFQEPGQSLDQFVLKLKMLSKDCNFETVTAEQHKDQFIRDAFIRGLLSQNIRQRLLEKATLDFQMAYDSARSLELAEKHSQSYNVANTTFTASATPSTNLQQSSQSLSDSSPGDENNHDPTLASMIFQKCYFCGYKRHPRAKCPARETICKSCSKKGHYQRVCQSVPSSEHKAKHHSASTQLLSATTASASTSNLKNAMIDIIIDDKPFKALVDSGSTDSYLDSSIAKKYGWTTLPSTNVISMASTSLTKTTEGHCILNLEYRGKIYKGVKLSLLQNSCSDVILGHDFISIHSELRMLLPGKNPPLVVCGVAAANVEPPGLFSNLHPDCAPIATKSRRHSKPDEEFISQEVKRLLKDDIIEPSHSPWRAQVLVTSNENHKRRMVVDYSQTINRYTYLDAYPQKRLDKMVEEISKFEYFSALDLKSAYHQIPLRSDEKIYTAFEAAGNLYQFKRVPFGVTNGVSCFQRVIDEIIGKENLSGTFAYVDNVTICGEDKASHDRNLERFIRAANSHGITFNEAKSVIGVQEIDMLGYRVKKGIIRPDPERLEALKNMNPPTSLKSQQRIVGMFAYYSQWISKFSDKIRPLSQNETFPLAESALNAFNHLKLELEEAVLTTINPNAQLTVETDASDFAISATLNQEGRPVAFFSRTLSVGERKHSSVEKEAYAIVEAIRKWRHYLINNHFKLITDQKSVSFIYDKNQQGKIKNDKIQRWKIELSPYSYDILYRPGPNNYAADALSRCGAAFSQSQCSASIDELHKLHSSLCHPGITRMIHFVRCKNLPYSVEEVKSMTAKCNTCAQLKPRFYKPPKETLVKSTQPFERISIDFKGPLPSSNANKYLLTVVDEFSRFPFGFPCPDMSSKTVINCLFHLFAVFGNPQYVHSDRGASFMSEELRSFLHNRAIATSRTTPYNPRGNGQVERLNGTLWKAITLDLKTKDLPTSQWEQALPNALHSIRSLLCTETNHTPHELMFRHQRRSVKGTSLPTWLTTPGKVFLKRNVRHSKYDELVDEVELLEANPLYAHIRHADGRESTVSLRQLAPTGNSADSSDHSSLVPVTPDGSSLMLPPLATPLDPLHVRTPPANPSVVLPPVVNDEPPLSQSLESEQSELDVVNRSIVNTEPVNYETENNMNNVAPVNNSPRQQYVRTRPYNLRSGPR